MTRLKAVMIALGCALALGIWVPGVAAGQEEIVDRPYIEILRELLLPEDVETLETLEEAMRAALAERAGREDFDAQSRATIAEMTELLEAERLPFAREDLIGQWSFLSRQTDDLGGYTYSFFPGRIYPEALALILDKTGGSQKHRGMLAMEGDDAMLYAGALYYAYDPNPRVYSGAEHEPDAEARERDEVGRLYRIGEERFILVLSPRGQRYEILELVPR